MLIQVDIGTVITFVSFVAIIGPGMYWLGKSAKQVDINTRNIENLSSKIDEIYRYVKSNGN